MFPPRPKHRIRPIELGRYEKQKVWVAQRKFNGTRALVHVTSDLRVEVWRPGKTPHLQWSISPEIVRQVLSLQLDHGKEYWFDGELLNNKTSEGHALSNDPNYRDYKNRIVFFDILQAGKYLFGKPDLIGRQNLLYNICRQPATLEPSRGIAWVVTENLWLAQTFDGNFQDRWNDFIDMPEIEGLVLKRTKSVLDNFGAKEYEVEWQLRCRKESKNYPF